MKRCLSWIFAAIMLLSLAACGQAQVPVEPTGPAAESLPTQPSASAPAETEPPTEPPFDPASLLERVTDIPPLTIELDWSVDTSSEAFIRELTDPKYEGRATGSAGNRAAGDWIAAQMEDFGLQPLMDDSYKHLYEDQVVEILEGSAAVVAADDTETPLELGVDWVFTPSWEIVELTLPLSAEIADCRDGKAVLDAELGDQKYPYTYVQVQVGDPVANTGARIINKRSASRIIVTQEVYDRLTAEGNKLHLTLPAAVKEGQAENICGILPGTDSARAVLITAHFDGSGACGAVLPSAYDNASGTGAMLQTASWLSGAKELPCDVIFVAFNGEENGKDGSKAFAQWLSGRYSAVQLINVDCVGWAGDELTVYAEDEDGLLRNDLAGALGIPYINLVYSSDQSSFHDANIQNVALTQWSSYENMYPELHTTADTPELLDFAMIDQLAKDLCCWVMERG